MKENNRSLGYFGLIIALIAIYFIFKFFSGLGKYEGESAAYWHDAYSVVSARYEELKSCVEDNPHDAADQCL